MPKTLERCIEDAEKKYGIKFGERDKLIDVDYQRFVKEGYLEKYEPSQIGAFVVKDHLVELDDELKSINDQIRSQMQGDAPTKPSESTSKVTPTQGMPLGEDVAPGVEDVAGEQGKEVKKGDVEEYSGKGYRVESGNMGIPSNATAKNIIDFEADELGNEHVRENAEIVAKKLGIDLSEVSSEDIVWITRAKETAKELYGYGKDEPTEVDIPKGSVVLTDLGGDGVLVLTKKPTPKQAPHEIVEKEPWEMTLLDYAKSKLPKDQADQITDGSQAKSFRGQYLKDMQVWVKEGKHVPQEVLGEYYNSQPVEKLVDLKKQLYTDVDIESPIAPEEKLLDEIIAAKWGEKNQQIKDKRKVKPIETEFRKLLTDLKEEQGEKAYFDERLKEPRKKESKEVLDTYREQHPEGPIVLYSKDDRGVMITPSSKRPGKWQVTSFDERGFIGDTLADTEEAAIGEAYIEGNRIPDPKRAEKQFASKGFREGLKETEKVQAEWAKQAKQVTEKRGAEKPKPTALIRTKDGIFQATGTHIKVLEEYGINPEEVLDTGMIDRKTGDEIWGGGKRVKGAKAAKIKEDKLFNRVFKTDKAAKRAIQEQLTTPENYKLIPFQSGFLINRRGKDDTEVSLLEIRTETGKPFKNKNAANKGIKKAKRSEFDFDLVKEGKGYIWREKAEKPTASAKLLLEERKADARRMVLMGNAKDIRTAIMHSRRLRMNDPSFKGEFADATKGPGSWPLFLFNNKTGITVDEMVDTMIEAGWLAKGATEQDLIDAIDENITIKQTGEGLEDKLDKLQEDEIKRAEEEQRQKEEEARKEGESDDDIRRRIQSGEKDGISEADEGAKKDGFQLKAQEPTAYEIGDRREREGEIDAPDIEYVVRSGNQKVTLKARYVEPYVMAANSKSKDLPYEENLLKEITKFDTIGDVYLVDKQGKEQIVAEGKGQKGLFDDIPFAKSQKPTTPLTKTQAEGRIDKLLTKAGRKNIGVDVVDTEAELGLTGEEKLATVTPKTIDPDSLSTEVLSRMNRTLLAKGYGVRGGNDVKELLQSKGGRLILPDWIEAYEKAISGVEKRKAKLKKKGDFKNINWPRINALGNTTDLREAGYIKTNGSLVDLSGKREGGDPGSRSYDHREAGGTIGMQELIAYGYVRMDNNSGMFDMAKEPTSQQYSALKKAFDKQTEEITIDLEDGLGKETDHYYQNPERVFNNVYQANTPSSRIINDIKRFFAGKDPIPIRVLYAKDGQTVVGAFHPDTGRITLVAENLSKDTVWPTLLHEAVHQAKETGGWQGVFGKRYDPLMKSIDRQIGKGNKAWVEAQQKAKDAGVSDDLMREETITYFLANNANKNQNLWQRIVNAIRAWAVNMGIKRDLTDNDIVSLAENMTQRRARTAHDIVGTGKGGTPLKATRIMADPLIGGDTPALKDTTDTGTKYPQTLTDLTKTETFRTKGLGGLDIPSQRIVMDGVVSMLHNPKIRDAVIQKVPVDVMDYLRGKELTPKKFFHDKTMLSDLLTVGNDEKIPIGSDMASSLVRILALTTAKLSGVDNITFNPGELFAAVGTDAVDSTPLTLDRAEKPSSLAVSNLMGESLDNLSTGDTLDVGHDITSRNIVSEGGVEGQTSASPVSSKVSGKETKVKGENITPEMRESVMFKGQPKFMMAGKKAKTAPIQTEEFKAKMKGSKVTKTGKPWEKPGDELLLLHGTTEIFKDFDFKGGRATFFTDAPPVADRYVSEMGFYGKGSHVPVFLALKNPLIVDAKEHAWDDIPYNGKVVSVDDIVRIAKQKNHDGIIVKNVDETAQEDIGTTYAAFSPDQIISAFPETNITKAQKMLDEGKIDAPWKLGAETIEKVLDASWVNFDNPGGEWLENEISRIKNDEISGSRTGTIRGITVPVDELVKLEGRSGEHKRISMETQKVKDLAKLIKKEGLKEPPFINVEYDGSANINEGNHRVRAAKLAGLKEIPVEIGYYAGGERVDGPMSIKHLMKLKGASTIEDVAFKATGWTQEPKTNKWMFRIDDSGAKLKDGFADFIHKKKGSIKLGKILDHPKLYEAYPQLRDVTVFIGKGLEAAHRTHEIKIPGSAMGLWLDHSRHYSWEIEPGTLGSVELKDGKVLPLSKGRTAKEEQKAKDRFMQSQMSDFLHEISHEIQMIEGFARGGNPTQDADYNKLAGEIFAREAGSQYQGTPGTMEGIPKDQWIVKDGSGTSFSVEAPETKLRVSKQPTDIETALREMMEGKTPTNKKMRKVFDEYEQEEKKPLPKKKEPKDADQDNEMNIAWSGIGRDWSAEGLRNLAAKVYTTFVMQEYPIARIAKKVGPEVLDLAEKQIRKIRGKGGISDILLTGERLDRLKGDTNLGPYFKHVKESLKSVLDGIKSKQMYRDYETMRVAQRELALDEANKTREKKIKGLRPDKATKALDKLQKKYGKEGFKELEDISARHREFERNVILKPLRDTGWLSEEKYEAIIKAPQSKYYASFLRQMEEVENEIVGAGGDPLKAIYGSERKKIPSTEGTIANVQRTVNLIERQELNKILVDEVAPIFPDVIKEVPATYRTVKGNYGVYKTDQQQAKRAMAVFDSHEEALDYSNEHPGTIVVKRPNQSVRMPVQPKDTFVVAKDGKKKYYTAPPDILKALGRYSPNELKTLAKIFSLPARMLRAGATLSAEFIARNPVRDQLTAMVYSKYGYIPFWDLGKGVISHLFKKSKLYDEYKAAGAEQSYFVSLDREATELKARDVLNYKGITKEKIKTYLNPLKALQELSMLSEKGTRLGLYARARKKGASPAEAMTEAREGTLDFGRIGTARALNQMIAFWNANVQGTDKMIRQLKNPKTRGKTLFKIAMGITVPSILLWFYNNGDDERRERYQALPDWQKNFFWCIPIDNGPIIRIPKPFELGLIFGSLPERILDYMFHNDIDEIKGIAKAMKDGAMPGLIPTAVLPILESVTNYSFFREQPIEGLGMTGRPAGMRYTPFTPEVAKKVGEVANISPLKFQNWVQNWTGTLGKSALQGMDMFFPDEPPKVGKSWYEKAPGIKGFIGREPIGGASKYMTQFYDAAKDIRQTKRGFNVLREVNPKEAVKYRRDNRIELAMASDANSTARQLSDLRKQRDRIVGNKRMSSERKRTIVDNINTKMSTIAERFVKRYNRRKNAK